MRGVQVGECFGCQRPVFSREPFDIVVNVIHGQRINRYYHAGRKGKRPGCNPSANHSKD